MKPVARWAFNILTGASMLLCVAVAAVWVRSYWVTDDFTGSRRDYPLRVIVESSRGSVLIHYLGAPFEIYTAEEVDVPLPIPTQWEHSVPAYPMGSGRMSFGAGREGVPGMPAEAAYLVFPHYAFFLAFALLPAAWLIGFRRRKKGDVGVLVQEKQSGRATPARLVGTANDVRPGRRHRVVIVLAVAGLIVTCGVLYWYFLARGGSEVRSSAAGRGVEFYGLVLDEYGKPLADVEVVATADTLRWSEGRLVDVRGSDKEIRTRTDAAGRFRVTEPEKNALHIRGVNKRGYQWLIDLGWAATPPNARIVQENRNYLFARNDAAATIMYMPDPERPAIFPLQSDGSTVLGKTSRGGSDRFPDGRIVRNEPVTPVVPSTGPGMPQTAPERDARIRAAILAAEAASTQPSAK